MTSEGMLFDIQRFGLHDGPGIRTVVFFKGCPLRCLWCHNPESQVRKPQVRFRETTCVLCGSCVEACEHEAHIISEGSHLYERNQCTTCGACIHECLFEALQLTGRTYRVDEVMAEVRRDLPYYTTSGGGLTLTGGEPLAQPDFCAELLSAAREEGIHTCVETSGSAPRRIIERILPLVDLFLFDYKATGEDLHRSLTGVNNDTILCNLEWMMNQKVPVWLRCPLIPGINDTPEHLHGIAALAARFPQLERIELLPYHNVGSGKYQEYGLADPLPGLPNTPDETRQRWMESLESLGCTRAVFG